MRAATSWPRLCTPGRVYFAKAATQAFAGLEARVARVKDAGLLSSRTVRDAACGFHALCEGLAAVELCGLMPPGEETRIWHDALTALVAGFAVPPHPRSSATVS